MLATLRSPVVALISLFSLLVGVLAFPANAATFRGVVLAPDGAPVANASVWIGPTRLHEYSVAKGTMVQTFTGADGAFSGEFPNNVAVSSWAFARVTSDRWALRDVLLEEGPTADNRISLEARKGITGTVRSRPTETVRLRYVGGIGAIAVNGRKTLLEETSGSLGWALWIEALPALETASDSQGRWQFAEVNAGGVRVESEGYGASVSYAYPPDGNPNGQRQTAIWTHPPVNIEGTIVTSDGAPLAGAVVGYGWGASPLARSDEKGHFVLRRVPREFNLDPVRLQAVALGTTWLLPKREVQLLRVPTIKIPVWTATRGVEVRGQAVDAGTGAALPGVTVGASPGQWQKADATGHFIVRVADGEPLIVFDENYRVERVTLVRSAASDTATGNTTTGNTIDVGKVALRRLVMVRGLLVDEQGQPVPGVSLTARFSNENFGFTRQPSDKEGAFALEMSEGQGEIHSSDPTFELLPAKTPLTVARDMAPLHLVVRRLAFHTVGGRIVTPQGHAVRGARVLVMVNRPKDFPYGDQPEFAENQVVSTQEDGRYSARFGGPFTAPRIEARAPDHRFRAAASAPQQDKNGDWLVPDVVLVPLRGKVWGQVLRADGQPAAGALVSCPETAQFAVAVCDEEGRFTLSNVPEDRAIVMAAQGRDFARVTVQPGVERTAKLRLVAPRVFPASERRRLLDSKVPEIQHFVIYWDVLGTSILLALALQADGALPIGEQKLTGADWSKAGTNVFKLLGYAAARDPFWLRKNGVALLAKVPARVGDAAWQKARDNAEYKLALSSLWGDEASRRHAQAWLKKNMPADTTTTTVAPNTSATPDTPSTPYGPSTVQRLAWDNALRWFQSAGIAAGLGDKNASALAANGIKLIEQHKAKRYYWEAPEWGAALAPGGPTLLALLKNTLPLADYAKALSLATQRIAPLDWRRAAAIHALMLPLEEQAGKLGEREVASVSSDVVRDTRAAFHAVLRARAATDPTGALQQLEADIRLRRVERKKGYYEEDFGWGVRAVIARHAWTQKQTSIARLALQPALEKWTLGGANQLAYLAGVASRFDSALAGQLWRAGKERLRYDYDDPYKLSDFAVRHAPFDRALSRLQLEWCAAVQPDIVEDESTWLEELNDWSESFVTVNFERALELRGQREGEDGKQAGLSARFLTYLLAVENQRSLSNPDYNDLLP